MVPHGHVRPLRDLRRADAAEYGGKSANLGELLSAEIPVPPGFAVAAGAFRDFVAETGLEGTIASARARASTGTVDDLAAASKTIGEAMRFAPLSDALRNELAAHYELLGAGGDPDPAVAVRSSALDEDGEEASFAGQQESFLWVRGLEHVCDAVRDCWASLYTSRAIGYRAARGAGGDEPAMGVTVQAMADAEVSGVLFTRNPVSGDPSMVAIEASWGLGLAVVGGETTPDDFLVSKVTGEVVRRTVNTKDVEYLPDPAGRGTVRVEVPAGRRNEPCLGEEHLAALVDLARRVERHFGSHQDVEWALVRGQELPSALVVLQARPVTAAPEPTPSLSGSALSLVLGTFGAPPTTGKQD
jgi:phosphoenolpyruvate synthase/pyruvate phosphate dikinase